MLFGGYAASALCPFGADSYHKSSNGEPYYGSKKVEGADPETFHVLVGWDTEAYNPCGGDSGYAADKAHVYQGSSAVPFADPATFVFLGSRYERDQAHVYYHGKIIEGADAKTFRKGVYADAAHVYVNGVAVKDADPASYMPLGNGLARDSSHVFFGTTPVPAADPHDAKLLGNRAYWTSRNIVFSGSKQLAQADAATFKVAGNEELAFSAEDKDHYFGLDAEILPKTECRKEGEVAMACKGYIFSVGRRYDYIDGASLRYLGRFPFPSPCQVIANSLIYQNSQGLYEFYGDGTIMKFITFHPDHAYDRLDKELENRLCQNLVTQSQ